MTATLNVGDAVYLFYEWVWCRDAKDNFTRFSQKDFQGIVVEIQKIRYQDLDPIGRITGIEGHEVTVLSRNKNDEPVYLFVRDECLTTVCPVGYKAEV